MINWCLEKEKIGELYNDEKQTLQSIGNRYGVTRERIRQVMLKLGLATDGRRHGQAGRVEPRFVNIEDYLASTEAKRESWTVLNRLLPLSLEHCVKCGSNKNLNYHHSQGYPARRVEDLTILCKSCHSCMHRKGMVPSKRLELYGKYQNGISDKELMVFYNIGRARVWQIIRQVKEGNHTSRN